MFKPKLLNLLAYLPAALLSCLLSFSIAAQQADEPGAETPEAAATGVAGTDDANADNVADDADQTEVAAEDEDLLDIEDADLDDQTYEEDDDDFIPTEEVPADEPIPFPSNI